ncbi:hypothetical protein CBR_g39469 [Chara braunii]|uniref:Myb-like domain-containing protein n=1 Tax=Chara braunii TaxID=69332 RepID=A0A388LRX5_CHABU|nr:hypothetical protein CBR_g39469 [Chara braunii]|eukprot:GBG85005.1 hypothetical protein CBR_g39469 [Chara braunii]
MAAACGRAVILAGFLLVTCLVWKGDGSQPATTPEALLRAAMAQPKKTVLTLTSDVSLTSDLGEMKCPDLTVVGNCKTKGKPRLCKIDGRKRYAGFHFPDRKNLTLLNLEITGLAGIVSSPPSSDVLIKNCLLSNNKDLLLSLPFGSLTISRSKVVGNDGDFVDIFFGSVDATDVVFRSNRGLIFTITKGSLKCTRCGFERNTAKSTVVVNAGREYVTFSRSWFVGNSATQVGERGAAVSVGTGGMTRFCYCRFEGNTIAVAGGKKKVEHVYLSELIPSTPPNLSFCKKRPSSGIGPQRHMTRCRRWEWTTDHLREGYSRTAEDCRKKWSELVKKVREIRDACDRSRQPSQFERTTKERRKLGFSLTFEKQLWDAMEWYRLKASDSVRYDNTICIGGGGSTPGSEEGSEDSEGMGTDAFDGVTKTRRTSSDFRGKRIGGNLRLPYTVCHRLWRNRRGQFARVWIRLPLRLLEQVLMAARMGKMATGIGAVAGAMHQGNAVLVGVMAGTGSRLTHGADTGADTDPLSR